MTKISYIGQDDNDVSFVLDQHRCSFQLLIKQSYRKILSGSRNRLFCYIF